MNKYLNVFSNELARLPLARERFSSHILETMPMTIFLYEMKLVEKEVKEIVE